MEKVIRTERGWGGHYCCASKCLFRRNTLLECGDIRIVISTIGAMLDSDNKFVEIGSNRYYETMVFHATLVDRLYWDANVTKQIYFKSPWTIDYITITGDMVANNMHEAVVAEIYGNLRNGYRYTVEDEKCD